MPYRLKYCFGIGGGTSMHMKFHPILSLVTTPEEATYTE